MKKITNIILVGAIIISGVMFTGDRADAASKPAAPSIVSITSGTSGQEGEITVKWKKISANGYQLQYSASKGFTGAGSWSTSSASTVSKSITGLAKGTTYYFRVRSVKKSGSSNIYSNWSSTAQIAAHEHVFSSHVTEQAGCGKSGVVSYVCNGCRYSYEEELNPLSHIYEKSITKKATTKSAGTARYTCKRCGDYFTETIPKLSSKSSGSNNSITKKSAGTTAKATTKPAVKSTTAPATKPTKAQATKPTTVSATKPATKPTSSADSVKPTKPTTAKELTRSEKTLKARKAAVEWAIEIAENNEFHYGRTKWAHKSGCYFCGTNQRAGSGKRKAGASLAECAKTYCCNPFVTAAYHHGAGASEIDCRVKYKRINLAKDRNRALKNKKAFARISKPSRIEKLCEGDILLTPSHCMLYAGDGKVVHAAHHDNGKRDSYWDSSIVHEKISSRQWKRTSQIYRYLGTGRY